MCSSHNHTLCRFSDSPHSLNSGPLPHTDFSAWNTLYHSCCFYSYKILPNFLGPVLYIVPPENLLSSLSLVVAVGWIMATQRHYVQIPGTWKCYLTWRKCLCRCNWVKDLEMKELPCIIRVDSGYHHKCPYKKEEIEDLIETYRADGDAKSEAGTGMMQPQTQKCRGATRS